MNTFAIVFFAALACASAGIIAAPAAQILQGPSTRTTIVGPDGSSISAEAPGGAVVTDGGIIAQTSGTAAVVAAAPLVAAPAPAVVAAPSVLQARSVLAAPSVLAGSSLLTTGWGSTVIAGPSGTVTAGQPLAAPLAVVW